MYTLSSTGTRMSGYVLNYILPDSPRHRLAIRLRICRTTHSESLMFLSFAPSLIRASKLRHNNFA